MLFGNTLLLCSIITITIQIDSNAGNIIENNNTNSNNDNDTILIYDVCIVNYRSKFRKIIKVL